MSNELTRRRAIVSGTDTVEVLTEPVPPLQPGEVLVEMSVSGYAVRTRPASTVSTPS